MVFNRAYRRQGDCNVSEVSRSDQPEAHDEPVSRIVRHCVCLAATRLLMRTHLPNLDEGALRHFIQPVTDIVEQHSLLLREIVASSLFQAVPSVATPRFSASFPTSARPYP
jgi:hypothetical protein